MDIMSSPSSASILLPLCLQFLSCFFFSGCTLFRTISLVCPSHPSSSLVLFCVHLLLDYYSVFCVSPWFPWCQVIFLNPFLSLSCYIFLMIPGNSFCFIFIPVWSCLVLALKFIFLLFLVSFLQRTHWAWKQKVAAVVSGGKPSKETSPRRIGIKSGCSAHEFF